MSAARFAKVSVTDLEMADKRVFVRVDFNVPLEAGSVADDLRLRASLPTIRKVLEKRGRPILASHLGRPKGKPDPAYSLEPVARKLKELIEAPVRFAPDCVGAEALEAARSLEPGEILLLENLRFHPGEEKNDAEFAARLARLAEAYVNDAFGSAHRAHASVAALCRHFDPAAAGLLMEKELEYLGGLLVNPQRPYVAILGGAKVSDKVELVKNLLPRVDVVLIGGAMAYTFLAALGVSVGASRTEPASVPIAAQILKDAEQCGVKVVLPVDHRIARSFESPGEGEVVAAREIPDGSLGLDIGPVTAESFAREIAAARTILWNGPVGLFERPPFDAGSRAVAEAIAASRARSVAGGGDTAAALARFHLSDKLSHVSTGGGASLEFLSGVELPGVAALTDKPAQA
ncbi:MAG TPA: phosphoglycerate kinase [Candidatus Polarisedimenticolia bacterium]|nr:phosphoglycerate kinase [Candidatus Polarisedimenticolia bacterium]